jgi:small subunit ribosomal protein S20
MANHKSALKRIRTSERRRLRNRLVITSTRTAIKKARVASAPKGDADTAKAAVVAAIRALDKAGSKGILHKNNIARRKSRLMKRLNAMNAAGE